MRTPIAVVSSDCHLQGYTWAKYPELCGDSYHSFEQIISYCIEAKLPLFLAGDIINVKRPDPKTIGFLMDQISRMTNSIYFIQGQHEMNRERPWLNAHEHPIHMHRGEICLRGIRFYGIDYVPADQLQEELDNIPIGTNVLVAHQVWREHMCERAPSEGSFADIPYVQEVITGDFHAHKVTHFKGKHNQPITVISPGSTHMLALDEDPKKYFFVLHDDLSVVSVPIMTRPYYKARIGSTATLEAFITSQPWTSSSDGQYNLIDTLPEHLRKPVWHVEYYDSVPDIVKRLEDAAHDKAHLFLRPIRLKDEVPPLEGDERRSIEMQPSLEGYLKYCIPVEDPIYSTALRLLRSNDPKVELKHIVEETIAAETELEKQGVWHTSEVQDG